MERRGSERMRKGVNEREIGTEERRKVVKEGERGEGREKGK